MTQKPKAGVIQLEQEMGGEREKDGHRGADREAERAKTDRNTETQQRHTQTHRETHREAQRVSSVLMASRNIYSLT